MVGISGERRLIWRAEDAAVPLFSTDAAATGGRLRRAAPAGLVLLRGRIMRSAISPAAAPPSAASCDEIEALAKAVGGRQGRAARQPPDRLLRRLERVARAFFAPRMFLFCSIGGERMRRAAADRRAALAVEGGAHAGAAAARPDRAVPASDRRCSRPSVAALSGGRHAGDHGAARLDHRRRCGRPARISAPRFAHGAARSAARARPVAAAPGRAQPAARPRRRRGCGSRRRARGMARDPGGRRHRLAGGVVPVACRSAGNARSRNGRWSRAGAGAGSARKRRPAS